MRKHVPVALLCLLPLACASPRDQANAKLERGRDIPAPADVAAPPPRRRVAIDAKLQTTAQQELERAFAAGEPAQRAHALEGLRQALGADAGPQILKGLADQNEMVRFAATMAAGESKLPQAMQPLQRMLANEPNPIVQVGVRFALHRLGDTSHSHDLEKFAVDPDDRVRGQTAFVLGRLGEPSATKMLRRMRADSNAAVRQQAGEALWMLNDMVGLSDLVGLSVSGHPDDQMVGVLGLAGPRNPSIAEHIRATLKSEYLEVQLVAARALGMACPGSGERSPYDLGYAVAMKGAASRDARQRMLAGLALGEIARSDTQETLGKLLKDADSDVRIAAATAVLQVGHSPRSVNGQLPEGVVARAGQP